MSTVLTMLWRLEERMSAASSAPVRACCWLSVSAISSETVKSTTTTTSIITVTCTHIGRAVGEGRQGGRSGSHHGGVHDHGHREHERREGPLGVELRDDGDSRGGGARDGEAGDEHRRRQLLLVAQRAEEGDEDLSERHDREEASAVGDHDEEGEDYERWADGARLYMEGGGCMHLVDGEGEDYERWADGARLGDT